MKEDIIFTTAVKQSDFFDFYLESIDGVCVKATYQGKKLPTDVGQELMKIEERYLKLKEKKKQFDEKQRSYEIDKEKRAEHKKKMSDHIIRAEQKNTEYKNTILAFGKLYSSK